MPLNCDHPESAQVRLRFVCPSCRVRYWKRERSGAKLHERMVRACPHIHKHETRRTLTGAVEITVACLDCLSVVDRFKLSPPE